jgi:probable F420-dependent oxidoreductase
MKVGVVLPIAQDPAGRVPSFPELRAVAEAAEAGGLDSVWVFDHLLFRFGEDPTSGIHECWTILAAMAPLTRRVELGTLVLCAPFRNPALTAKMAVTLDHVSDGRLILGIGAGWHQPEFDAFGYPFDHRVSRFEDSVRIIHPLLRTGEADHRGSWYQADRAELLPRPFRPDMPLLIASKGPRMMELTARYADSWNSCWYGRPTPRWSEQRNALVEACRAAGRDPATLEQTAGLIAHFPDLEEPAVREEVDRERALSGTADEVAEGLRQWRDEGIGHAIVSLRPATPEAVARIAEAAALLREDAPVPA